MFSEAVKAILAEVDPKLKITGAERLMHIAYQRAIKGSYKHLELLLGYAEGRPRQGMDVTGVSGPTLPTNDEELDKRIAELLGEQKRATVQ